MHTRNLINEFLSIKRFAMIGVSRTKEDFSRKLFDEFVHRDYDVVPVNPNATAMDGYHSFSKVQDITPPVTSALLMVPPHRMEHILRDCADAGVTVAWIYGISGSKHIPSGALHICEQYGMKIITGYCPFMFLPSTAFFHRFHGTILKLTGKYPK